MVVFGFFNIFIFEVKLHFNVEILYSCDVELHFPNFTSRF